MNLEKVEQMYEGRAVSVLAHRGNRSLKSAEKQSRAPGAHSLHWSLGGIYSIVSTLVSIVFSRMPCGTSYKNWGYNKAQAH